MKKKTTKSLSPDFIVVSRNIFYYVRGFDESIGDDSLFTVIDFCLRAKAYESRLEIEMDPSVIVTCSYFYLSIKININLKP